MRGLYLVTDRFLCGSKSLADVILQAADGGISGRKLLEKKISTRLFALCLDNTAMLWKIVNST
jgi:hypothetical protein